VDKRQGSNKLQNARMDESIDQVNDMVLSQEGQPKLTVQYVKHHGTQAFQIICCPHHTKGSAAEML